MEEELEIDDFIAMSLDDKLAVIYMKLVEVSDNIRALGDLVN